MGLLDTEDDSAAGLRTRHDARALRPGLVLAGRYEIEAPLGEGAVGQVFRAFDRATRMSMALKVVRAEVAGRRGWLDKLGREVRHAREVSHPNLCRVYELAEADGHTFFTMELAERSLQSELADNKPRSAADLAADARALTAGLAAMHAGGLLHRDVKPANVLRMSDGRLVLTDLGLALEAGHDAGRAGTREYMAPELDTGGSASPRSDVWSLGKTLGEILRVDGSRATNRIELALRKVCAACVDTDPARRPPHAGAVLRLLEDLDGESLEDRLRRGPLPVAESLLVGRRILEVLAVIHRRGRVHGAIKPANIFLRGGQTTSVAVLDPQSDVLLADRRRTPRYLAPEQARNERDVDGRADLFAFGCVVYECLTGQPAFTGPTPLAVLARLSVGDGIDVGSACPTLAPSLVALLDRVLAMDRSKRPSDAGSLAADVGALADELGSSREPVAGRPVETIVLAGEQRVRTVVGVRLAVEPHSLNAGIKDRLLAETRFCGASLEWLDERSLLARMPADGPPSDQAAVAARYALRLKSLISGSSFIVCTGRGDALEGARSPVMVETPGHIHVDGPSAALLASRFELDDGEPTRLLFEKTQDVRRTVLGKDTPCVGRDRELATLEALFDECASDSVARAVLVTAPAGAGKSRVRHELIQRIQNRGEPFEYLIGHGDSLRAGVPFGMIGPALRAAANVSGDDPREVQAKRLAAHVSRHLLPDAAPRVAAFLGEMAGISFSDDDLPSLPAARQDPRLMADQILSAWLEWIDAECGERPVLLALEDLHWGDVPSVQLVDAALRRLRDRPLMVVAFSRPEVDKAFPDLWAERDLQRISLAPLTTRACQKLVRHVLGGIPDEETAWIVERADGNAFFLEELIRAVGAGEDLRRSGALPTTVLGMVQARFDALGVESKRVLRAASIFGETFPLAGVRAVLGEDDQGVANVDRSIDLLTNREVVFPRGPGEAGELVFRHALLRDAAYEMLTPADRQVGHRRAGEYLETVGGREPIVLVEHFERGGAPLRAAHWCRHAAAEALDANDLSSALARVERGVRCGAAGEDLGCLRLVEAQTRFWQGEFGESERAARAACANTSGVARWQAMGEVVASLGQQGKYGELERFVEEIRRIPFTEETRAARFMCLLRAAGHLTPGGRPEISREIVAEVEITAASRDPALRARLLIEKSRLYTISEDRPRVIAWLEEGLRLYEGMGDERSACAIRVDMGNQLGYLGRLEEAERHLRAALDAARRMDLHYVTCGVLLNLSETLGYLGRLPEARAAAEHARALARRQGDPRYEGGAELYFSTIAHLDGDPVESEAHARAAMAALESVPIRPAAVAALARALLAQGRVDEALEHARQAHADLESQGRIEDSESLIRLVLIDCLLARGDTQAARAALQTSYARLAKQAAAIDNPEWRASFLERLPDHARLVALHRHLGEESDSR